MEAAQLERGSDYRAYKLLADVVEDIEFVNGVKQKWRSKTENCLILHTPDLTFDYSSDPFLLSLTSVYDYLCRAIDSTDFHCIIYFYLEAPSINFSFYVIHKHLSVCLNYLNIPYVPEPFDRFF
ncbi:hypothetical protein [Nitrosomonas supralitoralis]|uniref:hypothetical protein n=1 Tax=Nitrosomonas supralitoralis TaxID=2116706 RepID=UPI001F5BD460|nr:hypothetical protein [Nitrosomonas supralitoralis]